MQWNSELKADSSVEDCEAWLRALKASPKAYHIDDDPFDVIGPSEGTIFGARTFTDEEAKLMNSNLAVVACKMDWSEAWEVYNPVTLEDEE